MTLRFHLRFATRYGQKLWVMGNHPALGNMDPQAALPMQYLNDQFWSAELSFPSPKTPQIIRYKFLLQEADGRIIEEWGNDRELHTTPQQASLQTIDTWSHAGEFEQTFQSGPFRNILLPQRPIAEEKKQIQEPRISFRVKAPLLPAGFSLRLIGSGQVLGNWKETDARPMHWQGTWWQAEVDLSTESFPLRYKYGVWDDQKNTWVRYEDGEDRILPTACFDPSTAAYVHDGFVRLPNNTWRGAGLSIPVFSIRTEKSFGVGEFADLPMLADWAKALGLHMIQILPVNDTTAFHNWKDSYPYAGISAFALHPIYLSLAAIAGEEHIDLLTAWEAKRLELNQNPVVDYEAVMQTKWTILRELYERIGKSCLASGGYKAYWKEQQHWLKPYCVFSYLRDKYQTADFSEWPEHNHYQAEAVKSLLKAGTKSAKAIAFYGFVQYHLHLQLKQAVQYLHRQGIILKGDIPIGVNRHGCDAWVAPELYHMNWQAGAPPDDFTAIGQNWGFPTYNWKRMQADGFTWWRQRFQQMELYFDAFRIDHILGFFRIWSIPTHAVEGLLGRFVPAIPIRPHDFTQRGIPFHADRYTKPYITDTYLHQLFGTEAAAVRDFFLEPAELGTYSLRPAFATQRQIERYFQQHDQWPPGTREKLYALVANVILLEEEGAEIGYHFRISMDKTYSYTCLPPEIQQVLYDLYIDYFYKRQDDFWFREAMHKLPTLKSATNMLVCGEDLGMVPHCVPDVMQQLGILSLEIQRMPKDPKRRFSHPQDAPYLSVVTPSTHDMSTLRAWWEEDASRTRDFYQQELNQWGEPPQFCEAWVNRAILEQHLQSPAMWCIFQVQDLLGCSEKLRRQMPQEERINDPANPNQYWQYRMHVPLEELVKETTFNEEFRQTVEASGRSSFQLP
jgi:4-alpha-glucanotransferase